MCCATAASDIRFGDYHRENQLDQQYGTLLPGCATLSGFRTGEHSGKLPRCIAPTYAKFGLLDWVRFYTCLLLSPRPCYRMPRVNNDFVRRASTVGVQVHAMCFNARLLIRRKIFEYLLLYTKHTLHQTGSLINTTSPTNMNQPLVGTHLFAAILHSEQRGVNSTQITEFIKYDYPLRFQKLVPMVIRQKQVRPDCDFTHIGGSWHMYQNRSKDSNLCRLPLRYHSETPLRDAVIFWIP